MFGLFGNSQRDNTDQDKSNKAGWWDIYIKDSLQSVGKLNVRFSLELS